MQNTISRLQPTLHDARLDFHEDTAGLVIEHAQEIPESFVAMLRQMKADSAAQREREFMHVGSIPVVFVEKYLRDGFNIFQEPVRETCKRLLRDGLDDFVVTRKRIY